MRSGIRRLVLLGSIGTMVLFALAKDEPDAGSASPPAETDRMIVVGSEGPSGSADETLTLLVTGNTQATLQWCACNTGRTFMASKRATVIRDLKRAMPGATLLDAGEAFGSAAILRRGGTDETERANSQLSLMESLEYDFGVLGPDTALLGSAFIARLRSSHTQWLCANLKGPVAPEQETTRGVTRRIGHHLVGFVPLASRRMFSDIALGDGVVVEEAAATYAAVIASTSPPPDLWVVFGPLEQEDIQKIVALPSPPAALITSSPAPDDRLGKMGRRYTNPEKTAWDEWTDVRLASGACWVYYTGVLAEKGIIYVQIPMAVAGGGSPRPEGYGFHSPTAKTPDDAFAKSEIDGFFHRAKGFSFDATHYERAPWAAQVAAGLRYVGAEACRKCHARETEQWLGTRHRGAYNDLVGQDRWFYPQCVACHTVGLGQASGFEIGDAPCTPLGLSHGTKLVATDRLTLGLEGVQCESCHGPASEHVNDPATERLERMPSKEVCIRCHDPRNSPDFEKSYTENLLKVRH